MKEIGINSICWLKNNDWCGSESLVRVIKIHKGGNAKIVRLDDEMHRVVECGVTNLYRRIKTATKGETP